MHILFYPPFKPLGHPNPSGDLVIATGLVDYLRRCGHAVTPVSRFRARWVYWQPWRWPSLLRERARIRRRHGGRGAALWLSYHTYYKAPDLLGPGLAAAMGCPYVVFQGIYSTKVRRNPRTWPGFILNRRSLRAARHVFTNRRADAHNLLRLLPAERVSYVPPGIYPGQFRFDPRARAEWRRRWGVGDVPVVLTAAMFRPGVKTRGLEWVICACGALSRRGLRLLLVIAGDGRQRPDLERLAARELPGNCRFIGKVPRDALYRVYSAGDLFVFPGFRESLGMVFLEAQSCGLPVVALDNGGIPEVVDHSRTGLLTPLADFERFSAAVGRLLMHGEMRRQMGWAAADHVRRSHDLDVNYGRFEAELRRIAAVGGATT